ncbi:MAG TPA: T9SS type A sorting domain-containing protein, partial [Flavobacteriales bacterium]|nr:T9SS type A sorting domain-containing protein [Flavobacteriales bacterium]
PGLAPGDYWLVQFMTMGPFLPSSGCGDSVMVTVPDVGNTCGNVSGSVYMDDSEDCVRQGSEPLVPGTMLEILPGPYYAITSAGGAYSLNLPLGSYTIEQQSATLDEHCVGTPIPFTLTGGSGLATLNIADTSLVALDAMLTMASGPARPGFPVSYALEVQNLTPAGSGALTLTFTFDPLLGFNSATPTANVAGNVITWTLQGLHSFQSTTVYASLQVPPDILLLGTDLLSTATVACANTDADLANNTVDHTAMITGAYDPNEKVVRTSSGWSDTQYLTDIDEYLDYTIRFQNTGSDTAFNIVVTDVIAPELDLGSFIAGASSHPYTVDIREGNRLRFAFYNIQLPDSNVNEPASHGFVNFRIRPTGPVLAGTFLNNTAEIFFDYNPTVVTEPCTLLAEMSTAVQENAEDQLVIFPNPASDQLRIVLKDGSIKRARIMAADGRVAWSGSVGATSASIDVSQLASGAFVLEIETAGGALHRDHFIIQRP